MSTRGDHPKGRWFSRLSWRVIVLLGAATALLTPAIAPLMKVTAPAAEADAIDYAKLSFKSIDELTDFLRAQRRTLAAAQDLAREQAKANNDAVVAGINARFDDELAIVDRELDNALRPIEEARVADNAALQAEHDQAVAELVAWYEGLLPRGVEVRAAMQARVGTSGMSDTKSRPADTLTRADLVDLTVWPCDAPRPECDLLVVEMLWKYIDKTPEAAELKARHKAELAELTQPYKAELAEEDARLKNAIAAAKAEIDEIKAEMASALAELAADHEQRITALEADQTALEDELDETLSKLAAAYKNDLADLKAARATRDELNGAKKRYKTEVASASEPFEEPLAAIGRQIVAENNAYRAEATALKNRYTLEQSALAAQQKTDLDALRAAVKVSKNGISEIYNADKSVLEARHDDEFAEFRGTFLAGLDAVTIDVLKLDSFLVDVLVNYYDAQFDSARADRLKELDKHLRDAISVRDGQARSASDVERAQAKADRDGIERQRRTSLDEQRRDSEFAAFQLARSQERAVQLLEADLYRLEERVRSHLEAQSFEPLGSYYQPATDQGSLFNVTKRIGVPAGATGAGVTVAVIDTGVAEVAGLSNTNIILGPDFSLESQADNLEQRDTNGHGTHLAGIIAGADAAWRSGDTQRRPDRALGVAPSANLLAIKAGSASGAVDVTQVMAAISWVIKNKEGYGIRVINLSFGTDGVQDYQIDPLSYAVEQAWKAGIVVVVAAGNDGDEATRLTNPATNPFIIAVGASEALSDRENTVAPYSSAGGDRVPDIWAPGKSIVSFRNPGSFSDTENDLGRVGDTLVRGSGSSQAAAVVSGAVALLLQQRPGLTPDQVKNLLVTTADQSDGPVPARFLRLDRAMTKSTPTRNYLHSFPPSTGVGTLDGARGSVRLIADDVPLTGEIDIFGRRWNLAAWTDGSWIESAWKGAESKADGPTVLSVNRSQWNRSAWSTGLWKQGAWTGAAWTEAGWNGRSWTGDTWVRSAWSGDGWVRAVWTDKGWVRSAWSSGGWVRSAWSSDAWKASGWVRSAWSRASDED